MQNTVLNWFCCARQLSHMQQYFILLLTVQAVIVIQVTITESNEWLITLATIMFLLITHESASVLIFTSRNKRKIRVFRSDFFRIRQFPEAQRGGGAGKSPAQPALTVVVTPYLVC